MHISDIGGYDKEYMSSICHFIPGIKVGRMMAIITLAKLPQVKCRTCCVRTRKWHCSSTSYIILEAKIRRAQVPVCKQKSYHTSY